MSQLNVDAIRHTSASSDAITLVNDGTATAKITNYPHRNLIINGAMQVAQRGTSSTTAGYGSLDRFQGVSGGGEEACTHSQHALTSSDTGPWAKGFRQSLHFQNGNQTGGADAGDYAYIAYAIEAQDLANSGWDYTSASSYITLSFWVKSSVAGNQYGYIRTPDGTAQGYSFSIGNLSANTWTKVTKKIPGNSNITINNDTGVGMNIYFGVFWGSDYTASDNAVDTWAAYSSTSRTPDFPTTWWTTNDATFEITGVQLTATDYCPDYPHISYGDELLKCQRYYEEISQHEAGGMPVAIGQDYNTRKGLGYINFKVTKRAAPTAANVDIGIDGGDATHDCYFNTTTSGTTIKSGSSTSIGNADVTTGAWTAKFSAEL